MKRDTTSDRDRYSTAYVGNVRWLNLSPKNLNPTIHVVYDRIQSSDLNYIVAIVLSE